jgi:hypothetical protein
MKQHERKTFKNKVSTYETLSKKKTFRKKLSSYAL